MSTVSHADQIQSEIKVLVEFIQEYQAIIDSYVSDFFMKNLSRSVKKKWWNALELADVDELCSLLDPGTWTIRHVWPLGLLAFRASVHRLALTRKCVDVSPSLMKSLFPGLTTKLEVSGEADSQQERNDNLIKDGQHLLLEHCYRRHVKPKKQHEISNLSKALHQLAQAADCDHIVDVGSGQGHLSRTLSFGYGHKVTTIEAAGCHAPKAKKFDREVQADIRKGRVARGQKRPPAKESDECGHARVVTEEDTTEPNHIVAMIDPEVSVDRFLDTLQLSTRSEANSQSSGDRKVSPKCAKKGKTPIGSSSSSSDDESVTDRESGPERGSPRFILTGLHACGDLTPTMLRVFVKCPNAVGLGSVGCCYMKVTDERASSTASSGYPMSSYLQTRSHHLSYEAREMACHFVEAYYTRLMQRDEPSLKAQSYRAALQEIICQKDPTFDHGCTKLTVKQVHQLTFKQYSERALTKLHLDPGLDAAQVTLAVSRIARWREVVAFYTLRVSLAPVVETLILLDRILYLYENGISSHLVPVFDPSLSPRNVLLLACKQS